MSSENSFIANKQFNGYDLQNSQPLNKSTPVSLIEQINQFRKNLFNGQKYFQILNQKQNQTFKLLQNQDKNNVSQVNIAMNSSMIAPIKEQPPLRNIFFLKQVRKLQKTVNGLRDNFNNQDFQIQKQEFNEVQQLENKQLDNYFDQQELFSADIQMKQQEEIEKMNQDASNLINNQVYKRILRENGNNQNDNNGDEISDEFLQMYIDFYIQYLLKKQSNKDKLPEDLNINDFYEYSQDISEGTAPFLKYDPHEFNSKSLKRRFNRIYDFQVLGYNI